MPKPSPQGTPEALPYPILRRVSRAPGVSRCALRQGVLEGCCTALSVREKPNAFQMSLWARLDVTTEHGRATRQDRLDSSTHVVRQRMRACIGLITHVQDCLERELVGVQGLSITTHASLHH